MAVGITGGN